MRYTFTELHGRTVEGNKIRVIRNYDGKKCMATKNITCKRSVELESHDADGRMKNKKALPSGGPESF